MFSETYQLGLGPYLARFGTIGPYVVQDRSGPVGTEWGRSGPNIHFWRGGVGQAHGCLGGSRPDKLEVCGPAILLKPHSEAKEKVALCLSDGERLSVTAFAPASFRS